MGLWMRKLLLGFKLSSKIAIDIIDWEMHRPVYTRNTT